jgi:hypothetical protein
MHTERDKKIPYNYLVIGEDKRVHRRSNLLWMVGEAGPIGAWLNSALLPGTMTIQRNEQPRYCTKDKTYGGALCSMDVALVLPPPLPRGRI